MHYQMDLNLKMDPLAENKINTRDDRNEMKLFLFV